MAGDKENKRTGRTLGEGERALRTRLIFYIIPIYYAYTEAGNHIAEVRSDGAKRLRSTGNQEEKSTGTPLAAPEMVSIRGMIVKRRKMKRITIRTLILFPILLFSCIFLFRHFDWQHQPQYVTEILSGFMGAVITIIITAILLEAQSQNEVQRERSIGVFNAKLKIYQGFCTFLNKMIADKKITQHEINLLREWSFQIVLVCGASVSDCIEHYFLQSHRYRKIIYNDLSDYEKQDFSEWILQYRHIFDIALKPEDKFITIGKLISLLKRDLGDIEISDKKGVFTTKIALDEIIMDNLNVNKIASQNPDAASSAESK